MPEVSRQEWGAKHKPRWGKATRPASGTVVHHTVTAEPTAHAECFKVMRNIEAQHYNQWGTTVGYHGVHCPHGYRFQGTPDDLIGAHNPGTNSTHYGECFMGNFTDHAPTPEAKVSLLNALEKRGITFDKVTPHRKYKATACPGDQTVSWMNQGYPATRPAQEGTPISVHTYQGEDMRKLAVTNIPLDSNGNGWTRLSDDVHTDDVVGVTFHNPDHRYDFKVPKWSRGNGGDGPVITFTEGSANARLNVFVFVAQ